MNYTESKQNLKQFYSIYYLQNENFRWWLKQRKKIDSFNGQKTLLNLLPAGKSVWIDNFGYAFDEILTGITSIEHKKNKIFLKKIKQQNKIFYSDGPTSKTSLQFVKKYLCPTSVVIKYGQRYTDLTETANNINDYLKHLYSTHVFVILELDHVVYNRMKYSQEYFIEELKKQFTKPCRSFPLSLFQFVFTFAK